MKKCIGILLSLVVLLLIAYYVMGMMVESTLNKNINAFPKNPILTLHLDKYQRGWFTSEASLNMKMHLPEQTSTDSSGNKSTSAPIDFDISFPLIIHHGPIICSYSGLRFGIGQVSTRPETHYGVLINYLNKTVIRYAFPSFSMQTKSMPGNDNFQFEWKGITSLVSIAPNVDKIEGNFDFHGLNGSAKDMTFKLDGVFNHLDMNRIKEGLWVGSYHLDIPSITASTPENKSFALEGFDYKVASNVQDNAFNLNFDLSLKKLLVNDQNYGPAVMKLNINNLDADAIAKINQKQMDWLESGENSELNALALFYELPKLLALGPELEIPEINLNLPQGQVLGNFKLSLAKSETFDPNQAMQNAKGEGQLRAPIDVVKALMLSAIKDNLQKQRTDASQSRDNAAESSVPSVAATTPVDVDAEAQKQLDALLEKLTSKGYLKVEGQDYIVQFKLENQKLNLNGQPLDPGIFQ